MHSSLPESVVRAVCREVLQAKSDRLNIVLEELALQLTPIVSQAGAKLMHQELTGPHPAGVVALLILELESAAKRFAALGNMSDQTAFYLAAHDVITDSLEHWHRVIAYCKQACQGLPDHEHEAVVHLSKIGGAL